MAEKKKVLDEHWAYQLLPFVVPVETLPSGLKAPCPSRSPLLQLLAQTERTMHYGVCTSRIASSQLTLEEGSRRTKVEGGRCAYTTPEASASWSVSAPEAFAFCVLQYICMICSIDSGADLAS